MRILSSIILLVINLLCFSSDNKHKLVQEFPFVSKLDPNIYGPPESAITKELVEREIKGFMTLEEVINKMHLVFACIICFFTTIIVAASCHCFYLLLC